MTKVIGVRFRRAGKIYFFAPGKYTDISEGDHVIVETARGVEYGNVVLGIRDVEYEKVIQPLKAVIRVATPEDDAREAKNREKEKEAFKICLEKIAKHKLAMKLIKVEYTFDNNKILFYFTADGRIDFRELVKDLASVFKTRIELRQIGVRDEIEDLLGMLYKPDKDMRIFNITKSYLHHEMDRGAKASGVKRIRIHDLRHSACAALIELGFSPVQIAERLGHESETVTMRYAHLYPSVQKDMADKLSVMRKGSENHGR